MSDMQTTSTLSEGNASRSKAGFKAVYTDEDNNITTVKVEYYEGRSLIIYKINYKPDDLNEKEFLQESLNTTVTFSADRPTRPDQRQGPLFIKIDEEDRVPLIVNSQNTTTHGESSDEGLIAILVKDMYGEGMSLYNTLTGTGPHNDSTDPPDSSEENPDGQSLGPINPDANMVKTAGDLARSYSRYMR